MRKGQLRNIRTVRCMYLRGPEKDREREGEFETHVGSSWFVKGVEIVV